MNYVGEECWPGFTSCQQYTSTVTGNRNHDIEDFMSSLAALPNVMQTCIAGQSAVAYPVQTETTYKEGSDQPSARTEAYFLNCGL